MQNQPPPSRYSTAFGGYGEGKDAAQVNAGPISPASSVPPAYLNSPISPGGPPGPAGAHYAELNAPSSFQGAQPAVYTAPHGGHGASELAANTQVINMPAELPVWTR
jgi:hypothetical protein